MSRNYTPCLTLPVKLTAAVLKHTFIDLTGANATAAAYTHGVAMTDGAIGEVIPVVVLGTAPVIVAAAITKGAKIEVAAAGQATTLAAGIAVARALEAATAAGQIIEALLLPN